MDSIADSPIKTAPCPKCAVCGEPGYGLHSGLTDRLFDAPGTWNLKRCSNVSCGLVWLDPMPLADEIGKAYTRYYTHSSRTPSSRAGLLKRARRFVELGYLASHYGYHARTTSALSKGLGKLLYLFPIHRRGVDAEVRCLPATSQGRLLDVGCGSGDWLIAMRERGWQVEGLDFDENAVKAANQLGLNVKMGSLEMQKFASDSFDAITLSHVIEHVPDPVETMRECHRILKPGGTVVLLTPNNDSLSHRIFKEAWRGLEPPRHLHIFSLPSMERLLAAAGFKQRSVRPFIVTSVIYDSLMLRWGSKNRDQKSWLAWGMARAFKILELCLIKFDPAVGDCVVATAIK